MRNANVSVPSTSSPDETPRSRRENRLLKQGFVDDNNEDLSYFHFSVLWPAAACALFSMTFFIVAIAASLHTDYIPTEKEIKRSFFAAYGSSFYQCNSTLPMPVNGLPSILNLFEINVTGNILFRLCVCIPMVVRLFITNCHSELLRVENEQHPFFFRVSIEVLPLLTFIEVFALALFSIITVHFDFPEVNRFCKIVFVIAAGTSMVVTTAIQYSFSRSSQQRLDHISATLKVICACAFCYLAPQFFQHNHSAISFPICFSYVSRVYAVMEYVIIAAYATFQLTSLIDIRHITFVCYPRTCSGECEPLDPQNFVRGAKYEHCRAFEYQQRRVLNL
ncbi:hypothetical protein GCK32_008741 [Trichostrongylus colubriformis]|uniref:Uncharacterized protein n=1 Tax=Trichostrongylus colubriformis TaxID=6319 RepID=A0AAN8FQG3_TRICO